MKLTRNHLSIVIIYVVHYFNSLLISYNYWISFTCLIKFFFVQLKMHRYSKKLTVELFRSTSTSENSPLNQETSEYYTQHKPQILTQTLIFRLVGEVELIQVLFSQIQLKENQFHIIIQMSMMKIINTNLRNGISD